jgi:hypothetical protein
MKNTDRFFWIYGMTDAGEKGKDYSLFYSSFRASSTIVATP